MTDRLTDLDTVSEDKPRIQNQKLFLTYTKKDTDVQLDKAEYPQWIEKMTKITPRFIRLAHEKHEDGRYHTHVLIDFGRAFSCRNGVRAFDYNGLHPHIKKVCTKTHWNACIKYIGKEDKENEDLKDEVHWSERVFESKTPVEAILKCADTPSHVSGVLQVWRMRPPAVVEHGNKGLIGGVPPAPLRVWQAKLEEMLLETADDRHIVWLVDTKGGAGKSAFCRMYRRANMEDTYVVTSTGGMKDFATIIDGAIIRGWNGRVLLLDIARSSRLDDIYECIEAVKNGMITAVKYQGGTVDIPQMTHVVVMSNHYPNVNKLSHDRWRIYDISDDDLRLLTLSEARQEPLDDFMRGLKIQ